MSSRSDRNTETIAQAAFIETLSDEFIAVTGFGAYVYLNPLQINRLFSSYLKQTQSLRRFVRNYVRQSLVI